MNHLFHQITWHQYLAAALIVAVIYYTFIILRCYRPELKKIRQRFGGNPGGEALQALQYPASETGVPESPLKTSVIQENHAQENISEDDILAGRLKACIAKAADKPFSPATLIPQLKQILQQCSDPAATARPAINHLIVTECEKTGTALLTEEEVDQWWES